MAFLENIVLSHSVMSNPMGWSPPGSSVVGISQARIPDWVAISYSSGWDTTEQLNNNNKNSRGSSLPRDGIHISCIGKQILYDCTTCKALIENTAQCNCLWNAMKRAITPEYHLVLTTFRYIYIYIYRLPNQSIFGFSKLPQKCIFTYGSVKLKSTQGPHIILGCYILISNISSNLQ